MCAKLMTGANSSSSTRGGRTRQDLPGLQACERPYRMRRVSGLFPHIASKQGFEAGLLSIHLCTDPEVLVVDWEDVPASFASLNVNWDPANFDHTDRVHL